MLLRNSRPSSTSLRRGGLLSLAAWLGGQPLLAKPRRLRVAGLPFGVKDEPRLAIGSLKLMLVDQSGHFVLRRRIP
ncbi:hypothetical protein X739_30155 [Mesorhizobium sp. LNHC220B00]|nr:hypothetical protein X739_30155 [Mesorhizobium sp. LNHC220B00]